MAAKIVFFVFLISLSFNVNASELVKILDKETNYAEIKIIDKITSRTTLEKLKLKNLNKVKDFEIFIDRCILDKRKGFLEIAALIQIKDIRNQTRDRVFLFNNWMFSSNSSINEIEHPNYDISLKGCS